MPSSGIQIPELPRKNWSREEMCVLESTGLLDGQHLELIGGELFNKMGNGWLHVAAVHKVFLMLMQLFGNSFVGGSSSNRSCPRR